MLWAVTVPNPKVKLKIVAEGDSRVRDRRAVLDERLILTAKLADPVSEQTEELPLDLIPNRRVRLAVEATSVNGGRRTETIDLVYLRSPSNLRRRHPGCSCSASEAINLPIPSCRR